MIAVVDVVLFVYVDVVASEIAVIYVIVVVDVLQLFMLIL